MILNLNHIKGHVKDPEVLKNENLKRFCINISYELLVGENYKITVL